MTDEQEAMVAVMTEREMIEVMVAMRKKANKRDWIWEDIEELADREYYRGLTACLGAVNTMVTEPPCQEQTLE